MTTITARLLEFFDSTSLSDRQLAKKIGLGHGVISAMKHKGTSISVDKLEKIFKAFPSLNPDWVINGIGPLVIAGGRGVSEKNMLKDNDMPLYGSRHGMVKERVVPVSIDTSNNDLIPIVDVRAAANYLSGYESASYIEELDHISIPHHLLKKQGLYRGFMVQGDSMYPTLLENDIVLARRLELAEYDDIVDLNLYTIVLKGDGRNGIFIKRIKNRLGDHGWLRCRSDNKAHPSFSAYAEDILEIWEGAAGLRIGNFPNLSETLYNKIDDLQDKVDMLEVEFGKLKSKI